LAAELGSALLDWLRLGNLRHTFTDYCANVEQVRELYGNLDNLERILTDLNECPPGSPAAAVEPAIRPLLRDSFRISIPEYFHDRLQQSASLYERLAREIVKEHDVVVTFNYDVACERELKRAGLWEISDGYGFSLGSSEIPPSKVRTLKLHGSVNWLEPILGGMSGVGHVSEVARPVVYGWRQFESLGYSRELRDSLCRTMSNPGGQPALIMGFHKRFYSQTSFGRRFEEFWEWLWSEAEQAIAGSDKIVIIGYSMPIADERARELVLGKANRDTQITVCCGNKTSGRIRAEFGARGFRRVRTPGSGYFEDYLDSDRGDFARVAAP